MGISRLAGIGAATVSALTLLLGILSAGPLCACIPLDANLKHAIGSPPMDEPDRFAEDFLRIAKRATNLDDVYWILSEATVGDKLNGLEQFPVKMDERLQNNIRYEKRRCAHAPGSLNCRFLLEKGWFGLNKIGFDLHMKLDATDKVTDVRVARFSEWAAWGN